MNRVLITGVNGFIGRNLTKFLKGKKGYKLFGVGRTVRIVGGIAYIQCDITSPDFAQKISQSIAPCDIIIHAAASIDFNAHEECLETNSIGTYHVCELANMWNCSQMIYLSSIPVIGTPLELPITEKHAVNPNTVYHMSKYFGEQILQVSLRPVIKRTILRLSSPIGQGMNTSTIVSVFLKRCFENKDLIIYGHGKRRQNYIDVRDLCEAVLCAIQKKADGLYLIAGTQSISNLQMAKKCIEVTKADSKIIFMGDDPEEALRWEVSIEKAQKELGYAPGYTVQESLSWIYEGMLRSK